MENKIQYLQLTDTEHKGEIVKQIGRKFYGYVNGSWKRRGMNIGYFLPESPEFECYNIITENDALKLLGV